MSGRTVWQGSSGDDSFAGPDGPNLGFVLVRTIPNLTGVSVDASFGDDLLRGTVFGDILDGEAGADTIEAGGGNDTLMGVGGLDHLYGGAGDDAFFEQNAGAADAAAVMDGGEGRDALVMDETLRFVATDFRSIEVLQARGVGDSLTINAAGFAGFERIEFWYEPLAFICSGGLYDFTRPELVFYQPSAVGALFTGSDLAETVIGTERDDVVDAGLGANRVEGGAGADTLAGSGTLVGGDGLDDLTGGAAADTLLGGIDADALTGGLGDDLLDGGSGFDVARYAGLLADAVLVSLGAGSFTLTTPTEGADTLRGVERVVFADGVLDLPSSGVATAEADFLLGGADGDFINALAGDDTVFGLAGADTLWGSHGADELEGGEGDDWLLGKGEDDVLFGDAGADTLDGGVGADTMRGGDGADRLVARDGDDLLQGDAGSDTLFGAGGNDTLEGGDDPDMLRGGEGDDLMLGGVGNDTLRGEFGADTLTGGLGLDRLIGEEGQDAFLFMSPYEGSDHVMNYYTVDDQFLLSAAGFGLPVGPLSPDRFETNRDGFTEQPFEPGRGVLVFQRASTNDEIRQTGRLFWDPDGAGGADRVLIAVVRDSQVLTYEEFTVVA